MYRWPPQICELGSVVKDYIDNGNPMSIADESGVIKELENKFAALHGRKYGLLTSSGTMALFSAYFAIGLLPGDEVICTVFSYHATASPLLFFGVKIVFCDTEPDTGNINVENIEALITPKTKAVVTNDQWGHPCDKETVIAICKNYGLHYVEDCSHAHFAAYKGEFTGTFGDVACWSLQGNKLLSGGEGGILLTDNQDIYEKAVLLGHNLKRPYQSVKNPIYEPLLRTGYGLKLRIHPLAAVIVLHQLKNYCFKWIHSRRKTLEYFEKQLESQTFLKGMIKRNYVTSMGAWYGFYPRADFNELGICRQNFVNYLKSYNIDADIPKSKKMMDYELFNNTSININGFEKNTQFSKCPDASSYLSNIVGFPSYTFYEYEEIDRIISVIKKFGG